LREKEGNYPLFNLSLGGIKKHVVYNKNSMVLTYVYLHFSFGKLGESKRKRIIENNARELLNLEG